MKTAVRALLTLFVFAAAAHAADRDYKTRFITSATLTIHVQEGRFITIRSFTQDKDVGLARGVIEAGLPPPSPTPTPTPTATPTSTPIPSPTPTPIKAPILTAALLSPPPAEFIKPIIIAGPATLTIDPVPGAALAITYKKSLQPIQPSPTATVSSSTAPITSSTSSAAATTLSTGTTTHSTTAMASGISDDDEIEWSTPSRTGTPSPTPTATPTARANASRATPTPTPTIIPSPTPTH